MNKKMLLMLVLFLVLAGGLYAVMGIGGEGSGSFPSASTTDGITPQATAGAVNIAGVLVCLPHKNAKGPQTLECAFGLKDEEGRYYGLRDSDPEYRNISNVPTGVPVLVKGIFTPAEDRIYQSVGVIQVSSILQLGK